MEEVLMENKKAHYGLATATTMIIGIVIGSGIFFKSDDVLSFTGGNVPLGVLVLCIGAFSIIFGSLTLTELSMRTKNSGGIVGYYEEFISKRISSGFGWFQTFVYYPSLNAVVSWVSVIYICSLFNISISLEGQILMAFVILVVIYAMNILSLKVGGYFQNLSTIIKLIPLLSIAIVGIFWTGKVPTVPSGVEVKVVNDVGIGWLSALAPIAFSYDGWIIATSITGEVKNPKKNMTLALIIAPLVILGVYLLYFIGITKILGPEYILSTGNSAVNKVGELFLGSGGSTLLLVFIIISVLGVVNGITLGSLRMPQALASKGMIPNSSKVAIINSKIGLSTRSCVVSFITTTVWLVLHYITQKSNVLRGGDISEIAIVFSYVCYIILYIKVLSMKKKNIVKSKFKGIVCPIFGCIGSLVILFGSLVSNPFYGIMFMLFCLLIGFLGVIYYMNKEKK
jgi:APA family basic amino acid/polyamine antiporter